MKQFLLIDGSYYIFYRYHALLQWWKHAKPDNPLGNPAENTDFVERFKTVFVKKIHEMIKKQKIDKPVIIAAMDCKRKDIPTSGLFNKPIILQFIWCKKIPYILTWSQGYFWPWYYYHFWGYSCYKCPFSTRLSFSHPWSFLYGWKSYFWGVYGGFWPFWAQIKGSLCHLGISYGHPRT